LDTRKVIKETFEKCYPNLTGYYLGFTNKMIDYLEYLNERESRKEKLALTWTYPESIQVNALNEAVARIEYHLIEKKEQYIWRDDKPENEYERGVYNAMRLLNEIVHWTNPG
jgi:hypothetical protein